MIDFDQLSSDIRALPDDDRHARAAVFDADHTLWAGDLGDDAFLRALKERRFKPESAAALAQMLTDVGETPSGEPHEDAQRIHDLYKEETINDRQIIAAELICYAGWSAEEVRELARDIMRDGLEADIHAEMDPLIEMLRSEGYDIYVVSGSGHWLVEAAVSGFDVAREHAFGAKVVLEGETLTTEMDEPLTFWEGKVEAIATWLGGQAPKVVFGDSTGDLAMLDRAQLAVAVNPRPSLIRALDDARPGRWHHFMPERTRGGRKIEPHTIDRIII